MQTYIVMDDARDVMVIVQRDSICLQLPNHSVLGHTCQGSSLVSHMAPGFPANWSCGTESAHSLSKSPQGTRMPCLPHVSKQHCSCNSLSMHTQGACYRPAQTCHTARDTAVAAPGGMILHNPMKLWNYRGLTSHTLVPSQASSSSSGCPSSCWPSAYMPICALMVSCLIASSCFTMFP